MSLTLRPAAHGTRLAFDGDTLVGHWVRPAGCRNATRVCALSARGTDVPLGNARTPQRALTLLTLHFSRHPRTVDDAQPGRGPNATVADRLSFLASLRSR